MHVHVNEPFTVRYIMQQVDSSLSENQVLIS